MEENHVEWHIGGASWEQNANAGNDTGIWGRTQQERVNSLFEKIIALPRKLRAPQLVSMITPSACACSQELEHFHNHQDFTNIRVKDPGNTSYYHDEYRWKMPMQRKITPS